jgi:hypothetical protein
VAPSTSSRVLRRSVFAARRRCTRRLAPKLLPRAKSSTRSGLARAARGCARLGLNFNATRARENTFSLSKRFLQRILNRISFNGYWTIGKRSAAVTHGNFDERTHISRCVWSLRFLYSSTAGTNLPNSSSSLSDLHLHFSRKVDRCRSLRGRRDHLFTSSSSFFPFTFTNLHLQAFKQCIFQHFFLCYPARSEIADGRPWPAFNLRLFTTRRYPGGCLTDFLGCYFLFLSLTLLQLLHCGLEGFL